MKKCATCGAVYADDGLVFCLSDGTALQFVRHAEETLVGTERGPHATLVFPPAQPTQPTVNREGPHRIGGSIRETAPPVAPPVTNATTVVKQGVSPVIVGIMAGLLILAVGAALAFAFKDTLFGPSVAVNNQNQPALPTASPTSDKPASIANNRERPAQPTKPEVVVINNQPAQNTTAPPANNNKPLVEDDATDESGNQVPGRYPQTATRALRGDDLLNLSCGELKIMRNEIFARHGFIFKTPDMRDYFSRQPWYRGTESDVTRRLSVRERANLIVLRSHEQSQNCR